MMDKFGNTAEPFNGPEKARKFRVMQHYHRVVQLDYIHRVDHLIRASVRAETLSADIVITALEGTWLGEPSIFRSSNGREVSFNWCKLLSPGLHAYFHTLEVFLAGASPTFMLAVDSLCMKLEGIVRSLAWRFNIPTFYECENEAGHPITREKDIGTLLTSDWIAPLVSADDLYFLRYLLIEKAGVNLRNEIAHSLRTQDEYSVPYGHLVFLAIMRLAVAGRHEQA